MAQTHLQLVNRVLRRLREDTVSTINADTYSRLIGEFVVDAYSEVLDEWMWEALNHRVMVDVVSGTSKYEITRNVSSGGNARDSDPRLVKPESELRFLEDDVPQVWVYDDDSDDSPQLPQWISPEAMREVKAMDRDNTESDASYFTVYNDLDTTPTIRKYVELYPEPTAARVLEMIFWTPPDRLEADGTTDAVQIATPDRPVFHLALMYALNERGEEIGEPGNIAEQRYANSLSQEKLKEVAQYVSADRFVWRRD